ncbi:polyamine-modulated factor 1-like isoform X4 [Neomonachus schauinslandi]|uniref:Polyamine-modulated factor 1-like isoform X4 n=1 Tax=Neomonachus schauinslandi TaxID=29088 RepID=A0A8M1MD73_NEOSC|nr:polyamine-modulated factor 1-like isoform X4 [Neomonachus schauinslandi]
MAAARSVNAESGREEKGPEGSCPESVTPGATIPRVKLLDTLVDTFLQKLVAAGSFQRFTDCYERLYQVQPGMTQRVYDKFVTQLQTSVRQRDALQRRVHRQEAENRQLAEAVRAGRGRVQELQREGKARQQAWQALHREQKELVGVLGEPE